MLVKIGLSQEATSVTAAAELSCLSLAQLKECLKECHGDPLSVTKGTSKVFPDQLSWVPDRYADIARSSDFEVLPKSCY